MSKTQDDDQRLTAERLIDELHEAGLIFFHDQLLEAYVSYDGTGVKISRVESKEFAQWIHRYTYRTHGKVISADIVKRVVATLTAIAVNDDEQIELGVRLARDKNSVWYDLGKSAVRITKDGWETVDKPPILFKRFNHQLTQVTPVGGGSIQQLYEFLTVKDNDSTILLTTYLVSAFFPDIIRPLLVLHGSQGAGKTTQFRILKDIIDPSLVAGIGIPKNQSDLMQIVDHHAFIFFDNVRFISHDLSDTLAQIITGISFNKRGLYTNDDDFFYKIRRPLGLNGIGEIVDQPDLLQRAVVVQVDAIDPKDRISEKELWIRFNNAKPLILGAIFDLMAATLRTVDAIELPQLPRMADYAIYGCAIADACGVGGHNFIEAYERNHSSQNASVLETQPLAQAIIAYLDEHQEFSGTADSWLEELDEIAFTHKIDKNHPAWPRNASRFGKTLERILPLLASHGIKKRPVPRGASRIHSLYKDIAKSADDAVVPSQPGDLTAQLALVESIFGGSQLLSDISTPFDDGTT